ncbi:prolyl aminopeptidase [Pseudohalocynthiibacter aestuariivivens]|jgi:proline iminopeptidase|uniref:Proline iminopeptidase n=1 Tax=Pseudohalocynthiibacter aestuariivivens TaxID=1591409 RepID=A0ABV5JLZ7_9RHOB|nr:MULTISPECIES: prolyl aminopeptidase [Pseudohalocynthiibacter]MBS9717617.1 prolyl aminopeptidase [Pseudohalocynthiibacter aestuariivivens]MCK0102815.1 prolyl aminopeptidase [Pseudohalocynthiibacter sp. F2068]
MDKYSGQKGAATLLFPSVEPYARQTLDVGDGHHVYVEECGNPNGLPVVVLHGGPGGGCSPVMRRFFDPKVYRIVLFDQRGCGRSTPHASVENNTTWHLVADIERIREILGISDWVVFGGSWGATLALVYAQAHPNRVRHLVLRGVFLATQAELDWFYGGGVGRFWPDLWAEFSGLIPEDEQRDMIAAYNKRLFCGDPATEIKYARAWTAWENALASITNNGAASQSPPDYAHAFARLENHYFMNRAFLQTDGQILRDMGKIADIPGKIVQGRYDMICPPTAAWELSKRWPKADLNLVSLSGHALSEAGISAALIEIMNEISQR